MGPLQRFNHRRAGVQRRLHFESAGRYRPGRRSGYYTTRLYENQGWTEIELHFNNYSGDSDGYICFFTEGAVLIDDVKVTSAPTFLAAPKVVGVTDFQADRFTIEWQPLRKAFEYYVDLYKMTYTSDTDGAFSEDFENYTAPQEMGRYIF